MKKSLIVLLAGVFVVGGIFVGGNKVQAMDGKIDVLFFYGTGCGHCEKVKPTIKEFGEEYKDVVDVHWNDVYTDREASNLFNFYAKEYNIASRGVPTLIIGDKVLQGDTPIISGIGSALLSCPGDCDLKISVESALAEINGDVQGTDVVDVSTDAKKGDGSNVPASDSVAIEAGLTSEINLTNKIILSIIGVLAIVGIAIFVVGKNKKDDEKM